jgi:hypothetical protein
MLAELVGPLESLVPVSCGPTSAEPTGPVVLVLPSVVLVGLVLLADVGSEEALVVPGPTGAQKFSMH